MTSPSWHSVEASFYLTGGSDEDFTTSAIFWICINRERYQIKQGSLRELIQSMAEPNCICAGAAKDLRNAQNMYVTRASSRSKRKIAELEAKVKQDEEITQEGNRTREVDWICDPGTPAKRTTQLVRTKAESWRMKTLLAKALDMKEAAQQNMEKERPSPNELPGSSSAYQVQMERRLSGLEDGVELINKKLTLLIRLLRQTISPDPLVQEQKMKEAQNFSSMQDIQDKVDRHVLDVGLDITSRMGGFPCMDGFP